MAMSHQRRCHWLQAFCFALFSCITLRAGVTVVQNVSPGATSWLGTPVISTVANPSSASTGEGFNGGGGNTNLSQTFTVNSTITVRAICIYAGNGSGTGPGTPVTLNVYDLGVQTTNANSYASLIVGTNLLGSGAGLPITYVNQPPGILQFDFTDSDQVQLQAGRRYAFEITGVSGTTPLFWQRVTSNPYASGAAYRNRGLLLAGGATRDLAMAVYTNVPPPPQCTVNWNDVRQRIDGFGGGVQFLNPGSLDPVPNSVMNTLFGTNVNQLSLSLLRIGIDPVNWNNNQLLDAQKAVAHGAGIIATPWTPPASMKDNGSRIDGSLLPAQYTNYARYLDNFAGFMASNGAPLKVISIQNEPDIDVDYDSCLWTPAQLQTFCRDVAGLITNAAVMMPESFRFDFAYSDPTLNDPIAAANIDYVGGHLYGVNTIQPHNNALSKGKPTWMTEYLINDQTVESALVTARQVHDCLAVGNMSAYIWWKAYGDANGVVNAAGVPQKRGFVLGQWSRFVRPNDYRIGVTNAGPGFVTAFKNTNSSQFAIVAVNTNAIPLEVSVVLQNFSAITSVTPWITSSSNSLSSLSAVAVTNNTFTYTLPGVSVMTFVGQSPVNTPPMLTPLADQLIGAGMTLTLTNIATDLDLPPQALTFSLLGETPTNATLNSTNGILTWRPFVNQAGTTNQFIVKVSDSGQPSLSATNTFHVMVNPLGQPLFDSISSLGGAIHFEISGDAGPDYSLLASTNLADWDVLLRTNSPSLPLSLTITISDDALRFYRLQLGP
jgi:glucuronoarabinoxylan endo-1,4-beta-xylanase